MPLTPGLEGDGGEAGRQVPLGGPPQHVPLDPPLQTPGGRTPLTGPGNGLSSDTGQDIVTEVFARAIEREASSESGAAVARPPDKENLANRALAWFQGFYLPRAEPDPRLASLTLSYVLTPPEQRDAFLGSIKDDTARQAVIEHATVLKDTYEEAVSHPLSASFVFREFESDPRLSKLMSHPRFLEVLGYLSDKAGVEGLASDVRSILELQQQATALRDALGVAAATVAGPNFEAGRKSLIEEGQRLASEAGKTTVPGGVFGMPGAEVSVGKPKPALVKDRAYLDLAEQWTTNLLAQAKSLGMDITPWLKAIGAEDGDIEFASGEEALKALETLQGLSRKTTASLSNESVERAGIYGPIMTEDVFLAFARLYDTLPESVIGDGPKDAPDVIRAIVSAAATADFTDDPNPLVEFARSIGGGAKSAVMAMLRVLAMPNAAVGEALYGRTGEVNATKFVFADGYVAYDVLDALEHSLWLLDNGAKFEAPQVLVDYSESTRLASEYERLLSVHEEALTKALEDLPENASHADERKAIEEALASIRQAKERAREGDVGSIEALAQAILGSVQAASMTTSTAESMRSLAAGLRYLASQATQGFRASEGALKRSSKRAWHTLLEIGAREEGKDTPDLPEEPTWADLTSDPHLARTYAKPVPVFGLESAPQRFDLSKWWNRVRSGEGEFVTNAIVDATFANSADSGVIWKMPAIAMGAYLDLKALSPYNYVSTGSVSAKQVTQSLKRLDDAIKSSGGQLFRVADEPSFFTNPSAVKSFGREWANLSWVRKNSDTHIPLPPLFSDVEEVAKEQRKVIESLSSSQLRSIFRFFDGRRMSSDWAAARIALGRVFGEGSPADRGGSGLFADLVLTRLKEQSGRSLDDILKSMLGDRKFLDQAAALLRASGARSRILAAEFSVPTDLALAASRAEAKNIIAEALPSIRTIAEQVPRTLGYIPEEYWTNPRLVEKTAEMARGLFLRDTTFGVPVTPMMRAVRRQIAKAGPLLSRLEDIPVVRVASEAARTVMSPFTDVIVPTQTPGTSVPVPAPAKKFPFVRMAREPAFENTVKMPKPLIRIFRETFATRAQLVDAQAAKAAASVFMDPRTGQIADEATAHLVSFLSEIDGSVGEWVSHYSDDTLRGIVNGYLKRQLGSSAILIPDDPVARRELFERVAPIVRRLHQSMKELERSQVAAGLLEGNQVIDLYLPHFYRDVERFKRLVRRSPEVKETLATKAAGVRPIPLAARGGPNILPRFGPVSLEEAITYGLEPETDAMLLLSYRWGQALYQEAKADYLRWVAAYAGVPAMKGGEAAVTLLDDARTAIRESRIAQAGPDQALLEGIGAASRQMATMKVVRDMLTDKELLRKKQALMRLSEMLGVRPQDLRYPEQMAAKLLDSEEFLKAAATKRKNWLDAIMSPEAREILRRHAQEALKARGRIDRAARLLAKSEEDYAMLSRLTEDVFSPLNKAFRESAKGLERAESLSRLARQARETAANLRSAEKRLAKVLREHGKSLAKAEARHQRYTSEVAKWARVLREAGWNPKEAMVSKELTPEMAMRDGAKVTAEVRRAHARLVSAVEQARQAKVEVSQLRRYVIDAQDNLASITGEAERVLSRAKSLESEIADLTKESRSAARKASTAARQVIKKTASKRARAAAKMSEALRARDEAAQAMASAFTDDLWQTVMDNVKSAADEVYAIEREAEARLAGWAQEHGVERVVARFYALAPHRVKNYARWLKGLTESEKKRALLGLPDPEDWYRLGIPFADPAQVDDYLKAEEAFKALGLTDDEITGILWDIWGATSLTQVPLDELDAFIGTGSKRWARLARFLVDPVSGRSAVRLRTDVEGWHQLAEAMGIPAATTPEEAQSIILPRLLGILDAAAKGNKSAIEVLKKVPPKALRDAFVPQNVTAAAAKAIESDASLSKFAGTLGPAGKAPLSRILANTFVPAEIGMAIKTLIGERAFNASEAVPMALATRFGDAVLSVTRPFKPLSRGWKTAVTGMRGWIPFFGRRNSIEDGMKSMMALRNWWWFSPSARKAFRADLNSIRSGMPIHTATGDVSAEAFWYPILNRGVAATFAARIDDVEDLARQLSRSAASWSRAKARANIIDTALEAQRTAGLGVPKNLATVSGIIDAGVWAATGDPWLGLAAANATMAATGFVGGATGWMKHASTLGASPSLAEWVWPVGPHAVERLENHFRLFHYWTLVKAGMPPHAAADSVLAYMRDYSLLSPGAKRLVEMLPFHFLTFNLANTKSQLLRLLDDPFGPAMMTQIPRVIEAAAETDTGNRPWWQSAAESVRLGGVTFWTQDEFVAALQMLSPLVAFVVEPPVGHTKADLLKSAAKDIWLGLLDPAFGVLVGDQSLNRNLPPRVAKALYDAFGAFEQPGLRVWVNEDGVPRAQATFLGALALVLSGLEVGVRDATRLGDHVQFGHTYRAFIEGTGFGKFYRQPSTGEVLSEEYANAERWLDAAYEAIRRNEYDGSIILDAFTADAVEQARMKEAMRQFNSDDIRGLRNWVREVFRRARGVSSAPLPPEVGLENLAQPQQQR